MFEVLRGRSHAPNGGVTATADHIFIRCTDGPIIFDVDSPDGSLDPNLFFYPEGRGGGYYAAKPEILKEGLCGPMHGGALAETSDSRSGGIIYRIHDRFETTQLNAILSE